MFNLFIEDKGYCKCYAIDERIADKISMEEKEELLRIYYKNEFFNKTFSLKELQEEMFLLHHDYFMQTIAFEGMFFHVVLKYELLDNKYFINHILIDHKHNETTNDTEEIKEEQSIVTLENNESNTVSHEQFINKDSMRFIEATKRRNSSLQYVKVEKLDTTKYKQIRYLNEKGLYFYIDNINNNIKLIDTINEDRSEEMCVDSQLEAILWLLGYEKEYIALVKQDKNIAEIICEIASTTDDCTVIEAIELMNYKKFLEALSLNPNMKN